MKKWSLLLLGIGSCFISFAQSVRYYVDNTNTAANPNGLSWATAFSDFQTAIDSGAAQLTASDVEIWIKGTGVPYIPTDSLGVTPFDARHSYFVIPTVSKKFEIYGGFAGSEISLAQRPAEVQFNPTYFSGDVGTVGVHTDNLNNILYIKTGNFANFTVTLDGIIFQHVNTYSGSIPNQGAVYNERTTTRFVNCFFTMNTSVNDGAAIHSLGFQPLIDNCVFSENKALQGGALLLKYTGAGGTAYIVNSKFIENEALLGGAVKIDNLTNCYIANSQFIDNTSPFNGNGSALSEVNSGRYSVVNSNFISNNGNSLFHVGSVNITNFFVNCIFYKNFRIRNANNNFVNVSYSLSDTTLAGYTDGGNNVEANPGFKFYDEQIIVPSFANYALQNCSPAINAGNNANIDFFLNGSYIAGDAAGNPRKRDGIVDIGAYEYAKDTLAFADPILRFDGYREVADSVYLFNCTTNQIVQRGVQAGIPAEFIPTADGDYAFIYTYIGGCVDTTDCKTITVNPMPAAPSNLTAVANVSPITVTLNWTDNAFNEAGYEVERSTDGVQFTMHADLIGANISTYQDNLALPATTYYYRVVAYGNALYSNYSNVVQVTTASLNTNEQASIAWSVYPNPASQFLTIQLKDIPQAMCALYDLQGKKIASQLVQQTSVWDVSSYPRGVYVMQIQTTHQQWTQKIILN